MSDAHDARRDGPSPPDDGLSASEKLVERWLQCMPLEREVEKQECLDAAQSLPPRELERRGLGLHKLYIASSETALFGRVLLTLQHLGLLRVRQGGQVVQVAVQLRQVLRALVDLQVARSP